MSAVCKYYALNCKVITNNDIMCALYSRDMLYYYTTRIGAC